MSARINSVERGFTSLRHSWAPAFAGTRSSANERGFTSLRRFAENGFTLIELLVALVIFAMLSAAGVMLLGNAVSAQSQVSVHLDDKNSTQRIVSLIDQDMHEAIPRISRTENGLLAPVFFSRVPSGNEPFLQFVRGGWTNFGDAGRPDIQKVEYWLHGGKFERRSYPMVDGAKAGDPALLMDGVSSIELSFRDASGAWIDQWQSKQPLEMPSAVRMVITGTGQAPLTLMFRVGLEQKPMQAESATDA